MTLEIDKILNDEKIYNDTYDKYYSKVEKDFSYRKKIIDVKFPDKQVYKFPVNKLLVNMIFWMPFMVFKETLTEDYIVETSSINSDIIAEYMDRMIERFVDESDEDNKDTMNLTMAEMIVRLGSFSLDFNKRIGNTISLRNLIELSKNNQDFFDIIHTRYEGNIDTKFIEDDMNKKTTEVLKILSENENCLQDYVNSKEGINKNQLTQFLVNIGPKPDLKENVFPKIVNTNFITDGMKNPSDYFINSNGGRKAAITNHSKTKSSGYLMRKLAILCMNIIGFSKIKDCKSPNYVEILMSDKSVMQRCDKRYYLDEKKGKLRLYKYKKDTIDKYKGKKLKFRSPITCACKGGVVCPTCYGKLAKINSDIHIGLLAILILTSQVTQRM